MKQVILIPFFLLILLLNFNNCFSQIKATPKSASVNISGTYQVREFVSYDQVQEKDYKGTGSWQKFPCNNCRVTIIHKDSLSKIKTVFYFEERRKIKKDTSYSRLGAYVTYTNYEGIFKCSPRGFKIGQDVYVIYGNSYKYKRRLKLSNATDAGIYTEK